MTVRELIEVLQEISEEDRDAVIFFRENETVVPSDRFILVKEVTDDE